MSEIVTNSGNLVSIIKVDVYAVSFAVNDNLSVSLGYHESERADSDSANVTMDGTSLQASYTVGGASIKFAENTVDNQKYASGTNKDGRTIALSLAF